MTIEFQSWPKTPRLFRDIVITEKVDGSNSAIIIQRSETGVMDGDAVAFVYLDGVGYDVAAQSRNRLIYPGKTTDNHGFARFVEENAERLVELLGEGRHYGEWWGKGVQGRYHVQFKGFALFNTEKHDGLYTWFRDTSIGDVLVEAMPVLYKGPYSEQKIRETLSELNTNGSVVSPFDPAEGIVVFHTQSRKVYKVTLDNNDKGKWELV